MITLYDELKKYCEEKSIQTPIKDHRLIIGRLASEEFKKLPESGHFKMEKIESHETIFVNAYPDTAANSIRAAIDRFFSDPELFIKLAAVHTKRRMAKFNYAIPNETVPQFTLALKECNMEVFISTRQKGKAVFRISYKQLEDLIKLGSIYASKLLVMGSKNQR